MPSGCAINPLNARLPSSPLRAWPAMGVLQEPSRAPRKARSHSTAVYVSGWLRESRYLSGVSSPVLHAIPMAPWATAGSISSKLRMAVILSTRSRRFRPAYASRVAATSPSPSLRSRDWTLPLKLMTLKEGNLFRICARRRSDALPMTDPSGSSASELPTGEMKASRTSSLGSVQGRTVPSGRYVGTSFIECTAMSTRPSRRASSISFVNRPFPPMSASGCCSTLSPVVLMILISTAPSSLSSGWVFLSRSLVR
mmetsp:Transcript_2771/g.6662  ORF Transcript_2771/g.6662 Transcript_2771/m.6662 type:complete len:254 (+) Transcript_2771:470-1231(+)